MPWAVLNYGYSASSGTGTNIYFNINFLNTSTLFAVLLGLKLLLALIKNSIFVADFLSIITSTENNGFTLTSNLYEINSKSPSGGMNEITLSFSNLLSLTHWWNLISSNSTDLALVYLPCASKNALSFNPNFNSGIPDNIHFTKT